MNIGNSTPRVKNSYCCVAASVMFLMAGCSSAPSILHWEMTAGPYAQNVSAFAVDAEKPHVLYAGLSTGVLFRSSDKGQSWVSYAVIDSGRAIHSLVQDPENGSRIFAATDGGLFISTEGERTWRRIPVDHEASLPARVVWIDPFKTSVLYLGTLAGGLYKSSDGGSTWTHCNLGLDARQSVGADVRDVKTEPLRPDIVYAAVSGAGLLKSSDAGETWSSLMKGVMYAGSNATCMVLHRKRVGVLCVGTDDGSIYKSTDGGITWAMCRSGRNKDGVYSLVSHPSDPEEIYAGTGSGALVSMDFGASWKSASPDLPGVPQSIVISSEKPTPSVYTFGQGVGIRYSSDNGQTWLRADNLLGGSSVSTIITDDTGTRVYAIVGSVVYRYAHETQGWEFAGDGLIGGTIHSLALDQDSSSIIYAGTANGPYRTTDGGKRWEPLSISLLFTPIQLLDTHPSIRTRLLASSDRGMQVSTDRGSTWSYAKPYNTPYRLRSLTFSPRNAGRIYGSTVDKGVIGSDDGGLSWREIGYWPANTRIEALTLDAKDQRMLYAWTQSGGGFRSTDNGAQWTKYGAPWKVGDTVHMSFDRLTPSSVMALVNNRQLFFSQEGGGTWVEIPIDPVPDEVLSIHWNRRTAMLYAVLRQHGVSRISLQASLESLAVR